jgi:FkbM family methyltransferase
LFISDRSELEAVYEVLIEDEYALPGDRRPTAILDLGSHIGSSVVAFKLAYPDANVVAVEPDPHSFSLLTRNVASFSGVTCLNVAVGEENGRGPLYKAEGTSWATSLLPFRGGAAGPVVEICTLDEILARAGIAGVELVKFDIEGSEWSIFGALSRLTSAALLVGEIHFTESARDFDAVRRALPAFELEILHADKYGGLVHAWRSPSS